MVLKIHLVASILHSLQKKHTLENRRPKSKARWGPRRRAKHTGDPL
jgi:hypothetical protein